jgi:uncharacterized protein YbjT (DUF2867 family)
MANDKTILITGATGKQGGAALRHLASHGGFKLRALTRKLDSDGARAIAKLGAEVVAGDLDDAASLERALAGAWGVLAVHSTEAGVEKEERHGKRLATLAREKGIQQYVYSSVGSAHLHTEIPHFESKAHVEQAVKQLGFPSHVILRPVFFMENLPWLVKGDKLATTLRPDTKLQMVAVDDLGKFFAGAFIDADKFRGVELDLAGDDVTMPEAAAALSDLTGKTITYQQVPAGPAGARSADLAAMFAWFEAVGYSADIPSLERIFGIRPITLKEWVRTQR